VKPPWKRPLPAPRPASSSSKWYRKQPNRLIHAKPPSRPLSHALRQRKPHSSRLLTRNKWYSE
ncbi:hypothetical protein OQN26_19065, partial [Citrobacter freundii]